MTPTSRQHHYFALIAGDGRPLLSATALALIAAGVFACLQAATGHLLPHDQAYLGIDTDQLRKIADGRLLNFMIHDRVAFGGALISIGVLYLYLIAKPLTNKETWSWWTLAISGLAGFLSFLTYLGYGYLDSWHGVATLLIAPLFIGGLWLSRHTVVPFEVETTFLAPSSWPSFKSLAGFGRVLLLINSACIALGGLIIMNVGMTVVFVPQDLMFIGLTSTEINAISPQLIPLIAHDRAGFGGAVFCTGITLSLCTWYSKPCPAMLQAIGLANAFGYGTAIGVHFPIGYTCFIHLAPAYIGALICFLGVGLSYRRISKSDQNPDQGTN